MGVTVKTRLSLFDLERLKARFADGASRDEICAEFHIGTARVKELRGQLGFGPWSKRSPAKVFTPEERVAIDRAARDWAADPALSQQRAAVKHGVRWWDLGTYAAEQGITKAVPSERQRRFAPPTMTAAEKARHVALDNATRARTERLAAAYTELRRRALASDPSPYARAAERELLASKGA